MQNSQSKDLDFEVNLLPILSVLSICICFLLTTAVWTRLGSIDINQAIGDTAPSSVVESGKIPDSVFLKVKTNGTYVLQWKKGEDSSIKEEKVISFKKQSNDDKSFWKNLKEEIHRYSTKANTQSIIVMPETGIRYGDTITLLDQLKSLSLKIGLAPAIKGLN